MEMNHEYASKGVAGAGLGTGIAGLSLGVINALGGLGAAALSNAPRSGGSCGCCGNDAVTALMAASIMSHPTPTCGENTPVTRYEMTQAQTIAAKDAEIGLLKADKYTDQKLTEVTAYLMGQIKDLASEVRANKDEQTGINMQQVAYNATNTATISCLQNQVNALMGLTKLVVPNSSVCPGWGEVKVTPVTAAAAA